MVAPLTPQEIVDALTVWGIRIIEEPGWRTRSNNSGFGDVTGFMWHHTGDDLLNNTNLEIVVGGHEGLPGPLCNFGLRDDGRVHLVAAGGANHAGGGDIRVLQAVQDETYGEAPPAPRFTHDDLVNGVPGTVLGNPRFYGVESFYHQDLTGTARSVMPRLAAAVIWALDRKDTHNTWTAKSAIGHKEWQKGKPDPRLDNGETCADLRRETQAFLDAGPEGRAEWWRDMADIPDTEIDRIARRVWRIGQIDAEVFLGAAGEGVRWSPDTTLAYTLARTKEARANAAAALAKVDALTQAFTAFAQAGGGSADLTAITSAVDNAVDRAFAEHLLEGPSEPGGPG